jgi:monofunctional biosynthetic peptidoglycan transglycosylase
MATGAQCQRQPALASGVASATPTSPTHLKRAVIASRMTALVNHDGVDWDALEKAWQKNANAQAQAAKAQSAQKSGATAGKGKAAATHAQGGGWLDHHPATGKKPVFVGGAHPAAQRSGIGADAIAGGACSSKQRILEIYLNSVEWGEGVFGAEAAAQHYFRKPASKLSTYEAARLAVMLPRPKYFEKLPNSSYLSERAGTIGERHGQRRAALTPIRYRQSKRSVSFPPCAQH